MRRHLLVILVSSIGMLVWANGAFAADTLTLCVGKNGDIKAGPCKGGDTTFNAVSAADLTALQARVSTLEGKVAALEAQNTAQQTAIDGFTTLLAGVSRTTGPTLLLTGMNLQVVNGSGSTDGTKNSLGNVIIGYNTDNTNTKTGSHNLVIGDNHTYTSTSGIVSGTDNTLSGRGSFVSGDLNTASARDSFVSGFNNSASGGESFVGGGFYNIASGHASFVGGGSQGSARGVRSFVGGGFLNIAIGNESFVGGDVQTAGPNGCAKFFGTIFGTC